MRNVKDECRIFDNLPKTVRKEVQEYPFCLGDMKQISVMVQRDGEKATVKWLRDCKPYDIKIISREDFGPDHPQAQ